jgi:hypothetical protein
VTGASDLKAKILLAAHELSEGDLDRMFTSEELLVAAWKRDPLAFGLRGFEREYPDSDKIHRELDSRGPGSKGLVDQKLLERVESRRYRLTIGGLQRALELDPDNVETREKVDRELETKVRDILGHRVFASWLKSSATPKTFREAGQFWGIAPGTPPRVIKERIQNVDETIEASRAELDRRGLDEMADKLGRTLFDRADLKRISEFSDTLKTRFAEDLQLLGVQLTEP